MCTSAFLHAHRCKMMCLLPWKPEGYVVVPGIGVTSGYELLYMGARNLTILLLLLLLLLFCFAFFFQAKEIFLTTESSLSPLFILKVY